MRSRSLLLAAVAALAGCSLTLKTDELDPLKDAEGYCDALFSEYVGKFDSCFGATQYYIDQQYAQAKAMCADAANRNITYDRAAAQQYIDAIRAASCRTFEDLLEQADAPLVGNVQNYGACVDRIECADSRAECSNPDGTCPGQCLPPGGNGSPCDHGYPGCDDGYYCNYAWSPPYCTPKQYAGADCSFTSDACAAGTYCSYSSAPFKCQVQIPPPYGCYNEQNGCQSGSFCFYNSVNGTYTCTSYQAEGQYCDWNQLQCDEKADPQLACDSTTGLCSRTGRIGQPCNPLPPGPDQGSPCDEGYCDSLDYHCAPTLASGASCYSDSQCGSLRCIGVGGGLMGIGSCGRSLHLGEECIVAANDCDVGAYCSGAGPGSIGVCTSWPMHVGNRCGLINGELAWCYEGYCPDPFTGTSSCEAFKALGQACTYAGDNDPNDPCGPRGFAESAHCDGYSLTCVASCSAQ